MDRDRRIEYADDPETAAADPEPAAEPSPSHWLITGRGFRLPAATADRASTPQSNLRPRQPIVSPDPEAEAVEPSAELGPDPRCFRAA